MEKNDFILVLFMIVFSLLVVIAIVTIKFTDRLNTIESKVDLLTRQNENHHNIETSTVNDATPEEPQNVEIELRPEYASPDDAIEVTTEVKTSNNEYIGCYELTAYVATGNPCADGIYPEVGYTVACNDSRLWHKWIHIEGYGNYFVHDTGGMTDNVIDIFVSSYDEAIQFGRRTADVYIIGD